MFLRSSNEGREVKNRPSFLQFAQHSFQNHDYVDVYVTMITHASITADEAAWGEKKFTDSITAVVLQNKGCLLPFKMHNITPFIDAHCKWSLLHYWGLIFREIIMNYQGHVPTLLIFFFLC